MNFVERVVIQRGKIIAVRKFRRTSSISARAVENFYDRPKRNCRWNCRDPQKWRRQFRSDCFAHRIDESRDPFVAFVAINPEGYPSSFFDSRSETCKTGGGVRQMVQNTDGKCQIKYGTDGRIQQIADNNVSVRKLTRMRERNERAFAQIQGNNRFCAVRSHDGGVAPLSAAPLEYKLVRKIPGRQRGHPVEKLLFVVAAEIAPARPFLGKTRCGLDFDAGEVCGKENRHAIANREL